MKSINECIEQNESKKIFFRQEMGKRFSLKSEKDFSCKIVAIDNCVFQNSELKRCDYLFLINKREVKLKAFYVELKGINIKHACEQLYNSIKLTRPEILKYEIEAKVIARKDFHPNILNNEYFRKVKRLIKKDIEFHKVHKGNNYTYTEIL